MPIELSNLIVRNSAYVSTLFDDFPALIVESFDSNNMIT